MGFIEIGAFIDPAGAAEIADQRDPILWIGGIELHRTPIMPVRRLAIEACREQTELMLIPAIIGEAAGNRFEIGAQLIDETRTAEHDGLCLGQPGMAGCRRHGRIEEAQRRGGIPHVGDERRQIEPCVGVLGSESNRVP